MPVRRTCAQSPWRAITAAVEEVQLPALSSSSRRRWRPAFLAVAVLALALPAAALGYDEDYGPRTICGSPSGNCYIESSGAHTFDDNIGASVGQATYLACQLFQNGGSVNVVTHGYANCHVAYSGGAYVWARVYNESAFSDTVNGYAKTT